MYIYTVIISLNNNFVKVHCTCFQKKLHAYMYMYTCMYAIKILVIIVHTKMLRIQYSHMHTTCNIIISTLTVYRRIASACIEANRRSANHLYSRTRSWSRGAFGMLMTFDGMLMRIMLTL